MNQTDYTETVLLSILGFIIAFPEKYNWIENKVISIIKPIK